MKIEIERDIVQQTLEALEEIALAGMSGCGQESKEGMRDWHARQAWKFIGIAARALDPLREALAAPQPAQQDSRRPAAQSAYDVIDSFLRNNLCDGDYENYSGALEALYAAPQAVQQESLTDEQIDDALLVWCGSDISGIHLPLYRDSFRKAIKAALSGCKRNIT